MKLNMTCPINKTSYGYLSSYIMMNLVKLGFDVRHIPIGRNDQDQRFKIPEGHYHLKAPSLKMWHHNDMSGFTGDPKIGFTVFELEDLSETEAHNLSYPDKVIVPTRWAADVCLRSGVKASVVPLGYDPDIFLPSPPEESDNTIFFNAGKWEIRKGHDILIKAFNAAFEKDDKVTLVMMPTNGFISPEQTRAWERMYKESKLGEQVQLIPRVNTHLDVYNIMRQVDCAVFPARAEGWNMEALEMMGCGKEVIITNCTGHTGFVDDSCRLIDMPEEFETAYDGVFFGGFSKWRKFTRNSFDQLVEYMRDVHRNRISLKLNERAITRAKEFTWENSTKILAKEITDTAE